ncbi:MAG: recombinase family protein [Bacillota bacterium]
MAFYGRVSTEEQADRGNITGQVDFARRYFSLHAREENIDGFEMYLDEGVSGTLPLGERPGGARLMADARSGRISAVYFYRLDRLARSTRVVLETYNELEKLNVSIKSMTEAFDTGTPVGKFFMTLLASIAALERDTILERTQMGKERKAREGCWTSGPPPFGYRIGADKKLAIYNPEAEAVKTIFRLYNGGMSMVRLAEYLNALGVKTPNVSKFPTKLSSGLWHAGHISIILRSSIYMGTYQTMKRTKKKSGGTILTVPAIVCLDEFDRAAKMMAQNGDNARRSRGRRYLLSGIIYCGHCGRAMVGNSSGGGRHYYRCTGTVNRGKGKECFSSQLKAGDIEEIVWKDIKEFFICPENYSHLTVGLINRKNVSGDSLKDELDDIKRAISVKKGAKTKILSLVAKSLVEQEEAEVELQRLASEIELLTSRWDTLVGRLSYNNNYCERSSGISLLLKIVEKIDALPPSAEMARLLVRRVEVRTEEEAGKKQLKVSIYFRFTALGNEKPPVYPEA